MAGGTMLIFGGGALLGAVGGSGVSAAISMALATGASYVLNECAKLVVFCEEVLIGRYGDLDSAAEAHAALNKQIVELEVKIEAIKRGVPAVDTADGEIGEDQISPKKILKILKRSQKFLKRSSDRIAKAIEVEKKRRS